MTRSILILMHSHEENLEMFIFMAPTLKNVEGACCFGLVRASVRPFVCLLQKSSYSFEISLIELL